MNEANDILGKIEDAGELVKGGRIDRYWTRENIELNPEHFIGTKGVFQADWLHDQNKALEHFGLRSIEFGNWMNQEERANFLYASMLSLHHLAHLFQIEDHRMGFGGKLSLALGARGKGRAAGHYEPMPYSVINITKTHGIGVLAHEYAHAIDNVLSFYTGGRKQSFVSGGRTTRKGYDEGIAKQGNHFEQQFEELFNILYFDEYGNASEFHKALLSKEEYWNRRNEVFARTFEVYIADKLKKHGFTNYFLVSGISGKEYPSIEQVGQVSRIIGNIVAKGFHVMRNTKPLGGITINGYKGFRKTIKHNADLDDTLENMKRIAYRDTWQVKELAESLKGDSVAETAENIWNFLRNNTKYKLDKKGIEELRTPARSLSDGRKGLSDSRFGIDCDDYTILTSTLLLNLGIPHEYRVAAYEKPGKFQHIYVAAFDEMGNAYVIDPVPEIPRFNYEAKPIIDLKTVTMELQELSGIVEDEAKEELLDELNQPFTLSGIDEDSDDEILEQHFLSGLGEVDSEEQADIILSGGEVMEMLDRGILAEVNKARLTLMKEQKNPSVLSQTVNVGKELELFNTVMEAWDDEEERKDAILDTINSNSAYTNFFKSILYSLDKMQDDDGLSGLDDDDEIYLARIDMSDLSEGDLEGLGRRKGRLRNFFKKVGSGIKKGLKAVVRFNPATIAMRGAVLLLLKLNFLKFSEKIIYGYLTESQAKAQNLDLSEWRKTVDAKNKLENFYTKIGGKADKFKAAVVKGRAAKKTGLRLSGLGEAATAATAAATASPFIVFAKKVLNAINPVKLFKNIKNKIAQKRAEKAASGETDAFTSDDAFSTGDDFTPAMRIADNGNLVTQDGESGADDGSPSSGGFMQKVKNLWSKYKKPILITGVGGVIALIVFIVWRKMKSKKKRSLAGIKAARTRARNRKKQPVLKGTYRRTSRKPKALGNGSTTILKVPSKSVQRARVSKRSNTKRLKLMHQKAKELQKKHPNTKYSTLLKRASKLI